MVTIPLDRTSEEGLHDIVMVIKQVILVWTLIVHNMKYCDTKHNMLPLFHLKDTGIPFF